MEKYQSLGICGEGAFGSVIKCVHKVSSTFAILLLWECNHKLNGPISARKLFVNHAAKQKCRCNKKNKGDWNDTKNGSVSCMLSSEFFYCGS